MLSRTQPAIRFRQTALEQACHAVIRNRSGRRIYAGGAHAGKSIQRTALHSGGLKPSAIRLADLWMRIPGNRLIIQKISRRPGRGKTGVGHLILFLISSLPARMMFAAVVYVAPMIDARQSKCWARRCGQQMFRAAKANNQEGRDSPNLFTRGSYSRESKPVDRGIRHRSGKEQLQFLLRHQRRRSRLRFGNNNQKTYPDEQPCYRSRNGRQDVNALIDGAKIEVIMPDNAISLTKLVVGRDERRT